MGLADAIDMLRCPACRRPVRLDDATIVCPAGHRADVARQGFVTLSRAGIRHPGDTTAMVMARERVQTAGLLDPIVEAIVRAVPPETTTVIDLGAGTGHSIAAVVDAEAHRRGVALDSSRPALKRAARAHERVAAVGADLTDRLPLADGVVACCVVAFAPRPAEEIRRVLAPGGVVVIASPSPDHLRELVGPLEMLSIPDGKRVEVTRIFGPGSVVRSQHHVHETVQVSRSQAADLALMGPAGFHHEPDRIREMTQVNLPDQLEVTISVDVSVIAPPSTGPAPPSPGTVSTQSG